MRLRRRGMPEVFGGRLGYGSRPAVGVIDLQVAYTDAQRSALASDLDAVVEVTNRVLAAARERSVPVFFTVEGWDAEALELESGLLLKKIPGIAALTTGSELVGLDPRLDRCPGEPIICKKHPSAFFGTTLAGMLAARSVDTVILTGCSTSNCIRATAMDALNHGFRPIVPADGVGDRAPESHRASLVDIGLKYADVVSSDDVLAYLRELAPAS
jgi:maleamate amidohydrolase